MHEYSIATELLDEVARVVLRNGGGDVEEIQVDIGPLSGIEPMLLDSAFEQLRGGRRMPNARLVLRSVKLIAICPACDCRFEPKRFEMACPRCGGDSQVLQGDGLILQRIVLHQAEGKE